MRVLHGGGTADEHDLFLTLDGLDAVHEIGRIDECSARHLRFDQAHQNLLAEPVDPAGIAPDQSLGSLVADIIIAGQRRYRDQPVGAVFAQFHEQPEARDPADVGGEEAADRSGEKGRPIALDGGPLGFGGTPFGRRDVRRDRFQPVTGGVCFCVSEQRAVHQEVGIAADRRGEMGVAAQRQTEMPDIVRTVGGLRLAAQDEVIDQHGLAGAGGAAQHAVE